MVQTGNEFRCGTNANVFITLYGTSGDSGKRPLTQSGRDLFERNQKDNFELEAVDLGTTKELYTSDVLDIRFPSSWPYIRSGSASESGQNVERHWNIATRYFTYLDYSITA